RRVGAVAEEVPLGGVTRLPVVVIQSVFLSFVVGHEDRGQATAIVVTDVQPHAAVGPAAVIDGRSALEAALEKLQLARRAQVDVEEVVYGIVGNVDVRLAVAVEVGDDDPESLAGLLAAGP